MRSTNEPGNSANNIVMGESNSYETIVPYHPSNHTLTVGPRDPTIFTTLIINLPYPSPINNLPYISNLPYLQLTPPGVVMGLAWTSMGGSALYVEAVAVPRGEKKEGGGVQITVCGGYGRILEDYSRLRRMRN